MSDKTPTFVFEHGRAFAILDGKVIASAPDVDVLERRLGDPSLREASDKCPGCGSALNGTTCYNCEAKESSALPKGSYTQITTPNGLKGQIMGTKDIWGDSVTVRFANGQIRSYSVNEGELQKWAKGNEDDEKTESPIEELEKDLDEQTNGSKDELEDRKKKLKEVKKDARALFHSASHIDEQRLDEIIVTADYELNEIDDVLEHLESEEVEAFEPPAPYEMQSVEQESVGPDGGGWLEDTFDQMRQESQDNDFNQIMDEGPELFVSDLDDPALADAGTVRQMASNFIRGKTAGIDDGIVANFEQTFLERVEQVRKAELKNRKAAVKKAEQQKEASVDEGPDEGLFL